MDIDLIGVPMDLGADRRGVDMGPSAIRYADLIETLQDIGHDVEHVSDLAVPRPETHSATGPVNAKYLEETAAVCRDLREVVADSIDADRFPLVLGGDHSIAIGTTGGAARDRELGVLWFDAHGDFNTPETSPSGNVHGMSVAALLGRGWFADSEWAASPSISEENVALVGVRDLDDRERQSLVASDVSTYPMSDIDERGINAVVEEAFSAAADGVDGVHVSLDMDWLDPDEAPGVGTPVRGGATYREAHSAMELVAERFDDVVSMEIVEVNPILDQHNRTAELAVELVTSAMGKRIL